MKKLIIAIPSDTSYEFCIIIDDELPLARKIGRPYVSAFWCSELECLPEDDLIFAEATEAAKLGDVDRTVALFEAAHYSIEVRDID